jgi:hypothetical protein
MGVKWSQSDSDHLPPSGAEMDTWSFFFGPQYTCMVWRGTAAGYVCVYLICFVMIKL